MDNRRCRISPLQSQLNSRWIQWQKSSKMSVFLQKKEKRMKLHDHARWETCVHLAWDRPPWVKLPPTTFTPENSNNNFWGQMAPPNCRVYGGPSILLCTVDGSREFSGGQKHPQAHARRNRFQKPFELQRSNWGNVQENARKHIESTDSNNESFSQEIHLKLLSRRYTYLTVPKVADETGQDIIVRDPQWLLKGNDCRSFHSSSWSQRQPT